jgi:hypothetical protein
MTRPEGDATTRGYLPNVTLIALIVSCFIQIGAQLFAVSIIARVVKSAPPRSFAILEGAYRYDSSAFWQTVPPITGAPTRCLYTLPHCGRGSWLLP